MITSEQRTSLAATTDQLFTLLAARILELGDEGVNRPNPTGGWTVGQVTEHIIICSSGLPDKRTAPANRPPDDLVGAVREMFLNMALKFKTAPQLEPRQNRHSASRLTRELLDIKDRHMETITTKDLNALCLDMELPGFGQMTRYEWLCFIGAHTERHFHQINRIIEE